VERPARMATSWRVWFMIGLLALLYDLILDGLSTSEKLIATLERQSLIDGQTKLYGGPFNATLSSGGSGHAFIIVMQAFLIPCGTIALFYFGTFTETYYSERLNNSRSHAIGSVLCEEILSRNAKRTLYAWLRARDVILTEIIRTEHDRAQFGFSAMLVINTGLITYVAGCFVVQGDFGEGVWAPWTLVTTPFLSLILLNLLAEASSLAKEQQRHLKVLTDLKTKVSALAKGGQGSKGGSGDRLTLVDGSAAADGDIEEGGDEPEDIGEAFAAVRERIDELDEPVTILGIDITPTFRNVIAG